MKIGFPDNPCKNLLKEIEWVGRNKFDFIDLFLEEDAATPEKINITKVKKLLDKYNLDTVGHTAFYLPIGSPVKAFREAAVSEFERYLKVFSKLGVKYVTVHANWPSSMFSWRKAIKFQVESLKKIVADGRKYKINIMYESLDTEDDSIESVSEILKRVPGLYFHLDVGHTSIWGRKPEQFIRKFHKKLKHVHLHDNNLEKDLHLPLGKGAINLKKVIKFLKKYYDGTITLEIFTEKKKDVLASKKMLRKIWGK